MRVAINLFKFLLIAICMAVVNTPVAAEDPIVITNPYPPVTLVPPPGAADYPKPGDCGTVDMLQAVNGAWVVVPTRYCMVGYVTWLVNQPVAYYLESINQPTLVLIWNEETIDAHFKK